MEVIVFTLHMVRWRKLFLSAFICMGIFASVYVKSHYLTFTVTIVGLFGL